jgi:WD40 repeat protein
MRGKLRAAGWVFVAAGVIAVSVLVIVGATRAHDDAALNRWGVWATIDALPVAAIGIVVVVLEKIFRAHDTGPQEADARLNVHSLQGVAAREIPPGTVDRPEKVSEVVTELLREDSQSAAGTGLPRQPLIGLQGMGGFGKTTLAKMAAADPRVAQRYPRYETITIGPNARNERLAWKINELIRQVPGENHGGDENPVRAGRALISVLNGGEPCLLVVDDVWHEEQLLPFIQHGPRCAILVTTRNAALCRHLDGAVTVGEMSPGEARKLLTSGGLEGLDSEVANGLLTVTGRWPLLVGMVNAIIHSCEAAGQDAATAGSRLLGRLKAGGPAQADGELGTPLAPDQADERSRSQAVRATIQASIEFGNLDAQDVQRLRELLVFEPGKPIPLGVATLLWNATCGLDDHEAVGASNRLRNSALLSAAPAGSGLELHDVIRDFLRHEEGQMSLAEVNWRFLAGVAATTRHDAAGLSGVSWWELKGTDATSSRYLRSQLRWHLVMADRAAEAERLAADLHWASVRVQHDGAAALAGDLASAGTPRAERLARLVTSHAHLLTETDPPSAVVDVLHSWAARDPDWGPQAAALRDASPRPRLVNRRLLPDTADFALLRVVECGSRVNAVAVSRDGRQLAVGCGDGTIRIWETADWKELKVLPGRGHPVNAVTFSPDGRWLAVGDGEPHPGQAQDPTGTVRVYETGTWKQQAVLRGHDRAVEAAVFSRDGRRLATGSCGMVRLWYVSTRSREPLFAARTVKALLERRRQEWVFISPSKKTIPSDHSLGSGSALAFMPDGRHLVIAGGQALIWDTATWEHWPHTNPRGNHYNANAIAFAPGGQWEVLAEGRGARTWGGTVSFDGHAETVEAVAISPDGQLVATASQDTTARIWDAVTGEQRAVLRAHRYPVRTVAFAPRSQWLATGGGDGTVRIWDAGASQFPGPVASDETSFPFVGMVAAAADGTWLATAGNGVRMLEPETGQERASFDIPYLSAMALTPDGSCLVGGGTWSRRTEIWDAAAGECRAVITATGWVDSVAVSADGRFATGGRGGPVRTWRTATGEVVTTFADQHLVTAITFSPDGKLLLTGGADHTARIWDAEKGVLLHDLIRHDGQINGTAFTPDGGLAATAGHDGIVCIWDPHTGSLLHTFTGHRGPVKTVAISPCGEFLATGGFDGALRVWHLGQLDPQAMAMMRIAGPVISCAWLGAAVLAAGGQYGLHLFDFLR